MRTQKKDILITVSLVVHNQGTLLSHAVKEITDTLRKTYRFFEILVIDNGSTDHTYQTVSELLQHNHHVRALILSKQYDAEIGYMAVLDNCIGDFVILMDIASDPPAFIPTLIHTAQRGYDIVKTKKSERDTSHRMPLLERVYRSLYRNILHYEAPTDTSDFIIFSRRAVNSLTLFRNKHRYLHYLNSVIGFPQCTLTYTPRKNRSSDRRVKNNIAAAYRFFDMIISNSTLPLRFAAFVGVTASFLSLLYLLYTLIVVLVKKKLAEGWLTTSVLNASMFFLLFIILTILSEYIDRIIHETKEQPTYIIAEELSQGTVADIKQRVNVQR